MDLVVDAVGAKATRNAAFAAVKPGGVIMHVGLQDWASEIDMRKLTLAEITLLGTYTYTTADLRATVAALHAGVFGDLAWVEERPARRGRPRFPATCTKGAVRPPRSIAAHDRNRWRAVWPGLAVAGVVAIASTFLSSQYEPPAMLFALLLGMALDLSR